MLETIFTFLADNLVFFGIAAGLFVSVLGLLLFFGHLAAKTESTTDDSFMLRVLDVFTFWIPVMGDRIQKQIHTKPTQQTKEGDP